VQAFINMVQEPGEDSNLVRHSISKKVLRRAAKQPQEESLVASTAAIH